MPWDKVGHEIRHRVRDPEDFRADTFRTKQFTGVTGKGLSFDVTDVMADNVYSVLGKLKPEVAEREGRGSDSMVLQSVRFRTEVEDDGKWVETGWTPERAKEWWKRQEEKTAGEGRDICPLEARVTGEMRPEDISIAPGVDLDALKAGDPEPMEVVVEIPAGKSTRGWNYRGESLQQIVNHVNQHTLNGFLGHQKPEDVEQQFPTPVTHWVGGLWRDGKAYFRGVIDKAAGDLKRWIRAGRVKQVSIYGIPELRTSGGETEVIGYRPLSIDWTPLDRAGMTTRVVAIGEADSTFGELDGSYQALGDAISAAAAKRLGGGYAWVYRLYPDFAVVEYQNDKTREHRLYRFAYQVDGDEVKLSEQVEVMERRSYEPVGEISRTGGDRRMTPTEILSALKEAFTKKAVGIKEIVGELGLTGDQVVEALEPESVKKLRAQADLGGKLAGALGLAAEMKVEDAIRTADRAAKATKALGVAGEMKAEDAVKLAEDARKALDDQARAGHEKLVDDVLKDKVQSEMARPVVRRMLQVPATATKEQIAGEIDKILGDEHVKTLLSKVHVDGKPIIGGPPAEGPKGLTPRRSAI